MIDKIYKTGLSYALVALIVTSCTDKDIETIPLSSSSEIAIEYYNQGFELSQNIQGQEAVYYFTKAIGEDPDFAMAYLQLALVQTTPKLVFKYLNKAKSLIENVSKGEKLFILAMEAAFDNELEQQDNYLRELVDLYPNDALAHSIYGGFLYNIAKYNESIKHFELAIELNPDMTQSYNMLGYSYRQISDFDTAEEYFKQYIEKISDNPNPYDSYAELLLKKGDFEKSIHYYRKALEVQPTFFASKIGIATNLMLMEDHEAACEELESIATATADPGILKQMHYAKAVVNVDKRNFERALQELKDSAHISKKINDDLFLGNDMINLGIFYLMEGQKEKAIKYIEKSIEYFERAYISQELKYYLRRQLFVNIGWVAYLNNEVEKLKQYKEEYVSSAPQSLNLNEIRNVHLLSGHINMLEENYKDAIYEYNQANLENPIIIYLIGSAYENLGDYVTAIEYYYKAAHYNALNSLNYAYIRNIALDKLKEF